jgi:hypothetical protein
VNRDDIIRMARDSGFELHQVFGGLIVRHSNGSWIGIEREIERFAALVAAAEREKCAKVCDDMVLYTGFDCAAAIRARGQE